MSSPTPEPVPGRARNTFPLNIDTISLEQALRDFEIANARVMDLTQRLIASERRRLEVENELHQLRLDLTTPNTESPPSSRAVQWAIGMAGHVARRLRKK